MNENCQDMHAAADDDARASQCGHAEQLVAYLYGEAAPSESKHFERHMSGCVACREEFAAFGQVRHAVSNWRMEALSITPSLAREAAAPVLDQRPARVPPPAPSALAALREFFALSPLWLRATSVAALALICALAALSVARTEIQWDADGIALRTGVGQSVVERRVEVPVPVGVSQVEVDQLKAGYRREIEELRRRVEQNGGAELVVANMDAEVPRRAASAAANHAPRPVRKNTAPVALPRRVPRVNIAGADDEDIPRLYDLLGEGR